MAVYHRKCPQRLFYHAVASGDNGSLLSRLPTLGVCRQKQGRESVSIFTDRSLYRPGQVVRTRRSPRNEKESRRGCQNLEFTLRDATAEVSKQQLKSNEFGSMSGGQPAHQYIVRRLLASKRREEHPFQVEEYKRPTFEITSIPSSRHASSGRRWPLTERP